MTWFLAGSAALTVGSAYLSGQSAKGSAIRQGNAVSKAEGEATVRERLNATISNSYSTALGQMQLALKKRQLSTQSNEIGAAGLAARSDATMAAAATGSIGASTSAVIADIEQKTQSALDSTTDAFENEVENYNNDLEMMVINTNASAPTVRQNTYVGPSNGAIIGTSLMAGVSSFASSYAMRKMSLGAGK